VLIGVLVGAMPSVIPRMKNCGFANFGVAEIVNRCAYSHHDLQPGGIARRHQLAVSRQPFTRVPPHHFD